HCCKDMWQQLQARGYTADAQCDRRHTTACASHFPPAFFERPRPRRPTDLRCGRLAAIDRLVRFATRLLARERWPAWLLVAALGTAYTALDLARLDHFQPLECDLAIFRQGVW